VELGVDVEERVVSLVLSYEAVRTVHTRESLPSISPLTLHSICALLALDVLLLVCRISTDSTGLGLGPFIHERLLQHPNVLVQLVIQLLRAPDLAFLLCDFGFHFGALDVPGVPGTLVVVPFEL